MSCSQILMKLRGRYQREASRHLVRRPFEMRSETPLISFTFDDFPRSALLAGGAILRKYGVVGTYYTSLGLAGREAPTGSIFLAEDLKALLAEGHELGCHTFDHCHSWDTSPDVFEKSIAENQRALHALLPEAAFRSFSYPVSCPRPLIKRRVAKHFDCCRSGGQTFNSGIVDLNSLSGYFLEKSRDRPEAVEEVIDLNCRAQGWLILATHDVAEQPTPYGCTPSFFERIVRYAIKSGASVLPVGEAWKAISNGTEPVTGGSTAVTDTALIV